VLLTNNITASLPELILTTYYAQYEGQIDKITLKRALTNYGNKKFPCYGADTFGSIVSYSTNRNRSLVSHTSMSKIVRV
jgi:hypothetical protein